MRGVSTRNSPTGTDGEWWRADGAHESPFLFQLSGPCLGKVSTVQCARKEVKQKKKQMDSKEEYGEVERRRRKRTGGA